MQHNQEGEAEVHHPGDQQDLQPDEDEMFHQNMQAQEEALLVKVKETRARRDELRKEIKQLKRRNPKLSFNVDDTLGEKLQEYSVQQMENILENMLMELSDMGPWSGPEKIVVSATSSLAELGLGADIYERVLADDQLKVEFREMTGSFLFKAPAFLMVALRLAGHVLDEMYPVKWKAFINQVTRQSEVQEGEAVPPETLVVEDATNQEGSTPAPGGTVTS